MNGWFTAHKEGLRQLAMRLVEARGFGVLAAELYQNVADTGATQCSFSFQPVAGRPLFQLVVEDDDPMGFPDLTHAWTLFAPSLKKGDPTKAGRFNLGEKVVLAFCEEATIHTTCGTVVFDRAGRHEHPRRRRRVGTAFHATLACTRREGEEFVSYLDRLIVHPGLRLTINGREIPPRLPLHVIPARLPTEIAGEGGALRRTVRTTEVHLHPVLPGEQATLYELGIPVVETGDRWHYDVRQKVPLNLDRDNVSPAFLRQLRVAVLNEMYPALSEEDTTTPWVNEATSEPSCSGAAAEAFRVLRFGDRSVSVDPGNPEANAEAVAHGYTLIPSRALTGGQRQNLKNAGTLKSASAEFPLAGISAYSQDPAAPPVEVIPPEHWSEGMRQIHSYAAGLGERLLATRIEVRFVRCRSFPGRPWEACFGRGHLFGCACLDFNVHTLGRKWFEQGATEEVDALILHETAHYFESNHLSEGYHAALTRLGARLKRAALDDPAWFQPFAPPPS